MHRDTVRRFEDKESHAVRHCGTVSRHLIIVLYSSVYTFNYVSQRLLPLASYKTSYCLYVLCHIDKSERPALLSLCSGPAISLLSVCPVNRLSGHLMLTLSLRRTRRIVISVFSEGCSSLQCLLCRRWASSWCALLWAARAVVCVCVCVHTHIYIYTGCPRRNVPDFGRVFLMLKYIDITQNTYVQS